MANNNNNYMRRLDMYNYLFVCFNSSNFLTFFAEHLNILFIDKLFVLINFGSIKKHLFIQPWGRPTIKSR